MVAIASERLEQGKKSGLSQSDAWNLATCDWTAASNVKFYITYQVISVYTFFLGPLSLHCTEVILQCCSVE